MRNVLQEYPDQFDNLFLDEIREELSDEKYKSLKKHIIQTNESKLNLNWYMREVLKLEKDTRMKVLDLVDLYEFDE